MTMNNDDAQAVIDRTGITREKIRYALSGFIVGIVLTLMSIPQQALKEGFVTENSAGQPDVMAYPLTSGMAMWILLSLLGIFLTFRYKGHIANESQKKISEFTDR